MIFLPLRLGVTKCYMKLKPQSNSASNNISLVSLSKLFNISGDFFYLYFKLMKKKQVKSALVKGLKMVEIPSGKYF